MENTTPPMDLAEAHQVLVAFESGYVDANHPDLILAQEITGKSARIVTYESMANPLARLKIRRVGERAHVPATQKDRNNAPFSYAMFRHRH